MSASALRSLRISNFGPYKGLQELEFAASEAPLVLVHGENMAGKTSLLNSLRWLLYGEALDRKGRAMARAHLLNSESAEEGDYVFWVEAEIEFELKKGRSQSIVLKRRAQKKDGVSEPAKDADFSLHMNIEVDGNVKPESQFDDYVNMILPRDISRFFLFDGELLNEYENLVRDDDAGQAKKVKQAIEQILGLPAVKQGRDDIKRIMREVKARANREASHHAESEAAAEAAIRVTETLERAESNMEDLVLQRQEVDLEMRGYESDLERYQDIRVEAARMQEITLTIGAREAEISQHRESVRVGVGEVWRDALAPRLRHEIIRLEDELKGIESAMADLALIRHEQATLEETLEEAHCATCQQELPEAKKTKIRSELAELVSRAADLVPKADEPRRSELSTSIARLREIAPAGVISGVRANEESIRAAGREIKRLERDREKITDLMRDWDPKVVSEFERRRDIAIKRIGALDAATEAASSEIRELSAESARLEKLVAEKDVPELRQLRVQSDALEQGLALFERAIVDLIDELRAEVETEASRIFLELTTDKSYKGLEINDNYGLTIIGPKGKKVSVRSAGAEQVVALALIGALNRMAVQKAPVFMDTPMGRLDKGHRGNILKFIPSLGDQVMLLVHGGEIERGSEEVSIKGLVDREYEIKHHSSAVSQILPLKAGSK